MLYLLMFWHIVAPHDMLDNFKYVYITITPALLPRNNDKNYAKLRFYFIFSSISLF